MSDDKPRIVSASSRRIAGGDGLRALACLLVLGAHLFQESSYQASNIFESLIARGSMAVPLFFVLSGFLLSLSFWNGFHNGTGCPDLKVYAAKRLGRIVPGFFICVTILAVADGFYTSNWGIFAYTTTVTFTNVYISSTYFPVWDRPLWALALEIQFYMMLPLFALGIYRLRSVWSVRLYWMVVVTLLVVGQWMLATFADRIETAVGNTSIFAADTWSTLRNPFVMFAHFLFGFLAADVYLTMRRVQDSRSPEPGEKAGWPINRYDVIAVVAMVLFLTVNYVRGPFYSPLWFMDLGWPAFPILISTMILSMAFSRSVGRLLDCRMMRWLATISFGLYMWHLPILLKLRSIWPRPIDNRIDLLWFAIAVFVCACAVGQVSYTLVEEPVIRWIRRYSEKRKALRRASGCHR